MGRATKILFVEDSISVSKLFKKQFEKLGYEVNLSENGNEGYTLLTQGSYDIAVIDHKLPGRTGLEVIKDSVNFRELNPIPLVLVTASGSEKIASEAFQFGASDYIIKNENYMKLLPDVVEKVLNEHRIKKEKTKSEKALSESETKFRAVFESTSDAILLLDNGIIFDCNTSAINLLGFSTKEELIGRRPGDISEELMPIEKTSKTAAEAKSLNVNNNTTNSFECTIENCTGETSHLEVVMTCFHLNGKNVCNCLMHDITNRVQNEIALKKSEQTARKTEQLLVDLSNTIPDPIFVKDENHVWIMLNDSFCEFMGYSREDLQGKTDYDFFPREQADVFWDKDNLVFKSGKVNENIEQLTDAAGKTHTISTKKMVYKNPVTGKNILIGIIRDITSKTELERKIDKLRREHGAFMRHELKNMLTPIIGYSELILKLYEQELDESQTSYMNIIVSSTKRINCMVNKLKQLEDFEFNKKELETEIFDVSKLIYQAVKDIKPITDNTDVTIEISNEAKNTNMLVDRNLLPGVFFNLIKNAVEHISDLDDLFQKNIAIRLFNREDKLVITINNRGEPVRKEVLAVFFDKFNSTRKKKKGGTGLGTTYAYLVTKAHGGNIKVESDEENGTTLTILLDCI